MADFLTDLFSSIFTPGPTPTLIVATNISFAALQIVLLVLLILTYSIHFAVLSVISAGLWLSINWFVKESEAIKRKEEESQQSEFKEGQQEEKDSAAEDSGTETEGGDISSMPGRPSPGSRLAPGEAEGTIRRRRSPGSSTGDLSTDSEWDKVEAEGDAR